MTALYVIAAMAVVVATLVTLTRKKKTPTQITGSGGAVSGTGETNDSRGTINQDTIVSQNTTADQ